MNITPQNHYKAGTRWAGDDFTVIPGSPGTKRPMTKWKHFVWPERSLPTREEKVRFRTMGMVDGAQPLLLLDSPVSDAYCLCVIDIDDPSAAKDVDAWLKARGISKYLWVTTGRQGGGAHLYFRRKAASVKAYRSGVAKVFGKGANGKWRVDLKAYNSYTVAPGAVHKSGKTYTAYWDGAPCDSLEDIIGQLPELTELDWNELKGYGVEENSSEVEFEDVDSESLEWQQVVADGRKRQPCPWCKYEKDDRVLQYDPISGSAMCWHERKKRVRRRKVDEIKKEIDRVLADLTPEPVEDTSGDAVRHRAFDLYHASVASQYQPMDPESFTLFDKDDPLYQQEAVALTAMKHHHYHGWEAITCTRGAPSVIIGLDDTRANGGRLGVVRTSCWSFTCPDCGERLTQALGSALKAKMECLSGGDREGAQGEASGENEVDSLNTIYLRLSTSWRACALATAYTPESHKVMLQKLNRHAAKVGDSAFKWVCIQTAPGKAVYFMMFTEDGVPKFAPSEDLHGSPVEIMDYILSQIDLNAWTAALANGSVKRVRLLLGPSELCKEINALYHFLTGYKRSGKAHAPGIAKGMKGKKKGKDSKKVVFTSQPEQFIRFVEDTLRESLEFNLEEVQRSGRQAKWTSLPVSPVGLMLQAEKADKLVACASGHKKAQRIASTNNDPYIDLTLD